MKLFKIIVLFLSLIVSVNCYASGYIAGHIVNEKGHEIEITKIRANGMLRCKYKGNYVEIKFKDLKKIESLSNGVARVTNLKDKVFTVENASLYTRWDTEYSHKREFEYWYLDEISMSESHKYRKRTNSIDRLNINVISFQSENIGRMKHNPSTGMFFPGDYIYDPFNGEKLVWSNPR